MRIANLVQRFQGMQRMTDPRANEASAPFAPVAFATDLQADRRQERVAALEEINRLRQQEVERGAVAATEAEAGVAAVDEELAALEDILSQAAEDGLSAEKRDELGEAFRVGLAEVDRRSAAFQGEEARRNAAENGYFQVEQLPALDAANLGDEDLRLADLAEFDPAAAGEDELAAAAATLAAAREQTAAAGADVREASARIESDRGDFALVERAVRGETDDDRLAEARRAFEQFAEHPVTAMRAQGGHFDRATVIELLGG